MLCAILTILPLFGAGAAMFTKHSVDEATGKTQSSKSEYDSRDAPWIVESSTLACRRARL